MKPKSTMLFAMATVFGFMSPGANERCQQQLDDHCEQICQHDQLPPKCKGAVVARYSGPRAKGVAWRCYSQSALVNNSSYDEHQKSHCYCTVRGSVEGVLGQCKLGIATVFAQRYNQGMSCYRVPTIIRTSHGTLLAFAEQRPITCHDDDTNDLVLRRSHDGGERWGPILMVVRGEGRCLSNANPVEVNVGNQKAILLHFDTKNNPTPTWHGRNLQAWSYDDGLTWTSFQDITGFMPPGREGCMPGPSVGVQSREGTIYFTCHGPGDGAFLYWSNSTATTSEEMYVGFAALERALVHSAQGLLIISELTFQEGGRIDQIEVYASQDDAEFQVASWRPIGDSEFIKVDSTLISISKGYNKIALDPNHTIAVTPNDVLGWYSNRENPVVFTKSNRTQVLSAYGHDFETTYADMSHNPHPTMREYSLRVRVRRQLADYWEASLPIPDLDECSIALLSNVVTDDHVAMNCRTYSHARAELVWGPDGSLLSPTWYPEGLVDANCQGSLLSHLDTLYLSNTASTLRESLTIKRSEDVGYTWDEGQLIWDGISGYSQLVSWGSYMGVVFENGDNGRHERVSFAKWEIPFVYV